MIDIEKINDKVISSQPMLNKFFNEMHKVIIGQDDLIKKLFIAFITDGHILLEGVPGLAKTKAAYTFSKIVDLKFQRIQFTPDLLPGDIIGTQIYNPKEMIFEVKKGPVFANFILADEINRAPAKVQSALLEAMQEKQVTIGDTTFSLDLPFFVVATQNPIEQEGVYPLPEAQMDRFMFKIIVSYPTKEQEKAIMKLHSFNKDIEVEKVFNKENIEDIKNVVEEIYLDEKIEDYIIDIVSSTRDLDNIGIDSRLLTFGASPRAALNMFKAAKAYAFTEGRAYVVPQDVKDIAKDVLRHRILLSYEAEAENLSSDNIIEEILNKVPTP
jgi:MoxR-like ATPase